MKKIFFVFLGFLVSCATTQAPPAPPVDLVEKGVVKTDFQIVYGETMVGSAPEKVYFAKLSSREEFKSEKLIVSERIDSDGMIYINLEPGLYGVVATERKVDTRFGAGSTVFTFFDNDLIKRTAVQVEKGTTSLVRMRIMDYMSPIWGKIPESSKYYGRIIFKPKSDRHIAMIGKFVSSPETKKKEDEEKKKAEEIKVQIENY